MTTLKPRRTQSHTIDGALSDLHLAASAAYLGWPTDIVRRPMVNAERKRAERVFQKYLRYRTPEQWAPGDYVKLARLAADTAYYERETFQLSEGTGGSATLARELRASIAMLSRQLGLNTSPVDPKLFANSATARRRADDVLAAARDDDDLLALPRAPN
jgi:hypothetical protein